MIHQENFTVRAYEIDAGGRASAITICNYLQEVAGNHATKLGVAVDDLFKNNLTWVLSRLHVQFFKFPRWRDNIRVDTWPSGRTGKFATRDFLIFNQNNEVIVRGISSWMILDLKTLKPISMPPFMHEIPIPDRERAINDNFPKLPLPENPLIKKQFDVRLADLDLNQHVNNVKYIEWTLESIPLPVWQKKQISELEISFRAETRYGEGIIVLTEARDNLFLHNVISAQDNRNLAVVQTRWQDRI
jgi:medium-chain acyl-[acyl-carrier-protein] hydrolase